MPSFNATRFHLRKRNYTTVSTDLVCGRRLFPATPHFLSAFTGLQLNTCPPHVAGRHGTSKRLSLALVGSNCLFNPRQYFAGRRACRDMQEVSPSCPRWPDTLLWVAPFFRTVRPRCRPRRCYTPRLLLVDPRLIHMHDMQLVYLHLHR